MNFNDFILKIFKILIDELHINDNKSAVWYSLQV